MRRLTRARLADGAVVDVDVVDGLIDAVRPHDPDTVSTDDVERLDLGGWLLLPSLGEPHAHVDKALTAERVPNPAGDLAGAIEAWIAAAEAGAFPHDDMVARIGRALDLLLLHGVTAVRSHINCGTGSGLTHLIAAHEAIAPYRELMDVQLVALMHSPIVGPDGGDNRAFLERALDLGVDVIGGCPHLEPDGPAAVALFYEAAGRYGLPVDLHTDETLDPTVLTLRDMAVGRHRSGFDGPVAASHCVSLGMQPLEVQHEVAAQVAAAEIAVVTLPQTNLFLQGHDTPTATPRGLAPVGVLADAGVTVAAGGDNVQDPFNPVGRSDPLETAALLAVAAHVSPERAYEMVSNGVRATLGLPPVRIEPGHPADLLAIDATSIRAAIADAPADRKVFRRGRLVATSSTDRSVVRDDDRRLWEHA